MQVALIGAVMHTYFKIEKLSMCSQKTTLIPNHNIHGGSRHKVAFPYYIPKIVHIWLHHPCLLGVPMVGRVQYGYITPAFSGSAWCGEFNISRHS